MQYAVNLGNEKHLVLEETRQPEIVKHQSEDIPWTQTKK